MGIFVDERPKGISKEEINAYRQILSKNNTNQWTHAAGTPSIEIPSRSAQHGKCIFFLDETRVIIFGKKTADDKFYAKVLEYDFDTNTVTEGAVQVIYNVALPSYYITSVKQSPKDNSKFAVTIPLYGVIIVTVGAGTDLNITANINTDIVADTGNDGAVSWNEGGDKILYAYRGTTYMQYVIGTVVTDSITSWGTPVVSTGTFSATSNITQIHDKPLKDGRISVVYNTGAGATVWFTVIEPDWTNNTLTLLADQSIGGGVSTGDPFSILSPTEHCVIQFVYDVSGSFSVYNIELEVFDHITNNIIHHAILQYEQGMGVPRAPIQFGFNAQRGRLLSLNNQLLFFNDDVSANRAMMVTAPVFGFSATAFHMGSYYGGLDLNINEQFTLLAGLGIESNNETITLKFLEIDQTNF